MSNVSEFSDFDDRVDDSSRQPRRRSSRTHYRIYEREPLPLHIICEMDVDFAHDLGQFLLEVQTPDKRFKSFGHNLVNQVNDL